MHAHPHVVPVARLVDPVAIAEIERCCLDLLVDGHGLHELDDDRDVASTAEWGHYDKDAEL